MPAKDVLKLRTILAPFFLVFESLANQAADCVRRDRGSLGCLGDARRAVCRPLHHEHLGPCIDFRRDYLPVRVGGVGSA